MNEVVQMHSFMLLIISLCWSFAKEVVLLWPVHIIYAFGVHRMININWLRLGLRLRTEWSWWSNLLLRIESRIMIIIIIWPLWVIFTGTAGAELLNFLGAPYVLCA